MINTKYNAVSIVSMFSLWWWIQ